MLQQGTESFIPNTKTLLSFLKIDDLIIPITINEREYENSYLTSNYYIISHLKNLAPRSLHPLISVLGFLLKGMGINRVVIVNNWLLSQSIYPVL